MRFQNASILAIAAGAVAQTAKDAMVVKDNPMGAVYVATLPATAAFKDAYPMGGGPKGEIRAMASPNGMGVMFNVTFSKLPPKELGPFTYHLHVDPVPMGGQNCTATLAHLDPFMRGEDPPCDAAKPQTCQVGDLSGKWGKITSDPFTAHFQDDYASTKDGIGAFFGNRSFVLHYPNKTRLGCANFAMMPALMPSMMSSMMSSMMPSKTPGMVSSMTSSMISSQTPGMMPGHTMMS